MEEDQSFFCPSYLGPARLIWVLPPPPSPRSVDEATVAPHPSLLIFLHTVEQVLASRVGRRDPKIMRRKNA